MSPKPIDRIWRNKLENFAEKKRMFVCLARIFPFRAFEHEFIVNRFCLPLENFFASNFTASTFGYESVRVCFFCSRHQVQNCDLTKKSKLIVAYSDIERMDVIWRKLFFTESVKLKISFLFECHRNTKQITSVHEKNAKKKNCRNLNFHSFYWKSTTGTNVLKSIQRLNLP